MDKRRKYPGPGSCGTCRAQIVPWKKYCNMTCRNAGYVGKKASAETKAKMSAAKQGFMPVNTFKSGAAHPAWNPERTDYRERFTQAYRDWRVAVLKRDNYTCQTCGVRSAKGARVRFDVDHIKPYATHPHLRTEVSNGRTLCRPCHTKTETWGRKLLTRWEQFTGLKAGLAEAPNG